MTHNFQIISLHEQEFVTLFSRSAQDLSGFGAIRLIGDKNPSCPCRVSLEDAALGEEVILLPYQYHKSISPYQFAGPVFVRKYAVAAKSKINGIAKC